jgi:hypothetical protein
MKDRAEKRRRTSSALIVNGGLDTILAERIVSLRAKQEILGGELELIGGLGAEWRASPGWGIGKATQ